MVIFLVERMLHLGGLDTVRITNVRGHADEGMVLDGRVRELDRLGNNAADEAADFGRRRVGIAVIDARRDLFAVCGRWYPVILDLHRFSSAISRAVVNQMVGWFSPVEVSALFLDLCNLFKGLNSWVYSCSAGVCASSCWGG